MKPDANTTSTERSQAILAAMQEEMRPVVLGEISGRRTYSRLTRNG
jgi:fructose/tagatose bisphosphate aldolase